MGVTATTVCGVGVGLLDPVLLSGLGDGDPDGGTALGSALGAGDCVAKATSSQPVTGRVATSPCTWTAAAGAQPKGIAGPGTYT